MRQNGEKMSENNDTINNQEEEYEKICYICRRPESKAGKMIAMPGNVYVCQDCLQKTFDTINNSGMNYDDMMKMSVWLCKFCSTYYSHTYCCHLLTFIVFIEEERCSQSIVCPFHYYSSYFSFAIDVWLKLLYPCRSLYNSNTCNRKYFG